MTVVNRNIVQAAPTQRDTMQITWSCTVTKWRDRFGMFTNGQRHGTVRFIITLSRDATDDTRCELKATLAMADRRTTVLPATPAQCTILTDGELQHMDIALESEPTRCVLALTTRGDELVFAQSPLLHQAGFTGGSYDPPSISPAPQGRERE